jgi:membrane protein DedA with SNARE-associated domain
LHLIITYILLFCGIFLEGELIFFSAVIAAHQGILNIWLVVIIAISATISSDFFYFNAGKYKAKKWLTKSKFSEKIEKVNEKLYKHKNKMLFLYRFIYGMRILTPFVLGTQDMKLKTFMKYSVIGTLIWSLLIVSLGLAFGEFILNNLKHIEKIEYYTVGMLAGCGVIFLAYKWFYKKRVKI